MGGSVAIRAAELYGSALAGIVVIDTPPIEALRAAPPGLRESASSFGGDRTYPSRETALARFRLVPEHPVLPTSVRMSPPGRWPTRAMASGAGSSIEGCSER